MYSSTLPSTSALDGVGGQRHAPASLLPVKMRYPLCGRLGGPQGRSGRVRKVSPPTGIRSPDRPARSESLYRLRYPASLLKEYFMKIRTVELPSSKMQSEKFYEHVRWKHCFRILCPNCEESRRCVVYCRPTMCVFL